MDTTGSVALDSRLRAILALDPGANAIAYPVEDGERWTRWGELLAVVEEFDRVLAAAAIGEGAAVGVVARNRPAVCAAILAVLAGRCCVVTISPFQGAGRLAEDLRALRVPVLLACSDDWETPAFATAAAETGCLGLDLGRGTEPALALRPGFERYSGVDPRPVSPGTAVEMLTSGTTGPAKRIALSRRALSESILGARHYGAEDTQPLALRHGVALVSSPMVHIAGIFHLVRLVCEGRSFCLLDRFAVGPWRDAVRRHRPKSVSLVPAALKMVLDAKVPAEDLEGVRAVTCGTAPLAPAQQAAFEERYGIPVLSVYGATEFAGGVAGWTLRDHREFGDRKRGSAGRAHPNSELRIVAPSSGAVLPTGDLGLLEVRTSQAPTRGWIRTADFARIDEDGFLWIEGRADGAINRGGFKVDPAKVARVLEDHPAVREAAVVGVPDERLGEIPVAALELCAGAARPDDAELLAFAKDRLGSYEVPARFAVVDALPRTPSMKPEASGVRALFGAPVAPTAARGRPAVERR